MAEKAKRKVYTPQEQIARLEARLNDAIAAQARKNQKAADKLLEKRSAISKRAAKLDDQLMDIDAQLIKLGFQEEVNQISGFTDEPTVSTDTGLQDQAAEL